MDRSESHRTHTRRVRQIFLVLSAIGTCGSGVAAETPDRAIAQVVVTVARLSNADPDVVIPGDVQARYQSNVSFRVSGKISARLVEVGQHVNADQVLARIDPEQQVSNLRNSEAALASVEASLGQAEVTFARQGELMKNRFTTQPAYDQAEQLLRTTGAQVESGKAALGSAREQLSYTDLKANIAGIVTSRNAEVGQVIREGETVFVIAQDGPRDAVFNVYEGLLADPPSGNQISVALLADPSVKVSATVREISPKVDTQTGSVKVKATLTETPARMTLGATVLGMGNSEASQAVTLPWSALYLWRGKPAVWVVDPKGSTVAARPISVQSYSGRGMVLKDGISEGEHVVTAGIQFLRPGMKVAVQAGSEP